jgi:hypothetical protein
MNQATGDVTTLIMFKEDTCSVILAEEKALSPGPARIKISVSEFVPGNSQFIGNMLCFYQIHSSLELDTADTAAEAWN